MKWLASLDKSETTVLYSPSPRRGGVSAGRGLIIPYSTLTNALSVHGTAFYGLNGKEKRTWSKLN